MSSTETSSKNAPFVNFAKAIIMVILAIVAWKLLVPLIGAVIGIIITALIVLIIGFGMFGLFQAVRKM